MVHGDYVLLYSFMHSVNDYLQIIWSVVGTRSVEKDHRPQRTNVQDKNLSSGEIMRVHIGRDTGFRKPRAGTST